MSTPAAPTAASAPVKKSTPAAPTAASAPVKKSAPRDPNAAPKSFSLRFGPDKKSATLRVRCETKKAGYVVFIEQVVLDKDGNKSKSRGGSSRYSSLDEAKKAMDVAASKVKAKGWTESVGAGPNANPDKFDLDNIPAAK